MKHKYWMLMLSMQVVTFCSGQNILMPGARLFEKNRLKVGRTEMAYYAFSNGQKVEIGSFLIDIVSNEKTIAVYTSLQFLNSADRWIDTCIADANTFKPIYRSSYSKDRNYSLHYAKEVTGYYLNKQTQKRNSIQEPINDAFFDNNSYPYLLGLLPLSSGYKKELPVFEYKPDNKSNISKTRIEEVRNNTYSSSLTGEHKVWQVSVVEELTGDQYEYYIDKASNRIWKIEIFAKGQQLFLVNKEKDYNPFTTTFNKEETLKLIKNGDAVISGQVFARDNENDGALKGMAILNVHKKQFAKKGTSVILIPYTAFFKEWLQLNESSRKKGIAIPLPKEVADCIKTISVYDNEGHFEFVNLMPGDYLLYTEFGYVHSGTYSEVIGYTDTYINGMFQGSSANTQSHGYSKNVSAAVKKIVTVQKGENKVYVKLKKTL